MSGGSGPGAPSRGPGAFGGGGTGGASSRTVTSPGPSSRLASIAAHLCARVRVGDEDSALVWAPRDRLWVLQKVKGGTYEWFAGQVRYQHGVAVCFSKNLNTYSPQ